MGVVIAIMEPVDVTWDGVGRNVVELVVQELGRIAVDMVDV